MRTYSIYDAKAKLSELIRFVKLHGPIVITERGKPVVQVSPIVESELPKREARLRELQALNLLSPGRAESLDDSHHGFRLIKKRPGAVNRFLESRD